MSKIYANEKFPLPAVEVLRQLGHDVLTVQESGKGSLAIPDHEVLAFATESDRILLTFNRKHFINLHYQSSTHAGIVVCSVDPDFEALANRIHKRITEESDMRGKLLRVNRPAQ